MAKRAAAFSKGAPAVGEGGRGRLLRGPRPLAIGPLPLARTRSSRSKGRDWAGSGVDEKRDAGGSRH
jgi:hypothetical protein